MFATTTKAEANNTVPMIIGWSPRITESTASRPTPCNPKICSVTTSPQSSNARSRPNCVNSGVTALRNPWRYTTRLSDKPLARAVRM